MKKVVVSILSVITLSHPAFAAKLYGTLESYKVYELDFASGEDLVALKLKFDFIFDGCNRGTIAPELVAIPQSNSVILKPNLSMTKALCRIPVESHEVITQRFEVDRPEHSRLRILVPNDLTIEIINE